MLEGKKIECIKHDPIISQHYEFSDRGYKTISYKLVCRKCGEYIGFITRMKTDNELIKEYEERKGINV